MTVQKSNLESTLDAVERQGSAGEKQLARMLTRYGVRFEYEHPVAVVDRGKVRVQYPDFWLPECGVVIEYAGRMDVPDYRKGIAHKREVYEACGIPCVVVEPNMLQGYWPQRILDEIRNRLLERLKRFDAVVGANRAGKE